jgi:hypothetical protein
MTNRAAHPEDFDSHVWHASKKIQRQKAGDRLRIMAPNPRQPDGLRRVPGVHGIQAARERRTA